MQKKYLVIKSIGIFFLIMLLLVACDSNSNIDNRIIIKVKLKNRLSIYKKAFIHSRDAERDSLKDFNNVSVNDEISAFLYNNGIDRSYDIKIVDLQVECLFQVRWGLPRIVRGLVYKYVTKVNIKLIDASNQEVIGEVEYLRPWLKDNPRGFIQTTLAKLIESGPK